METCRDRVGSWGLPKTRVLFSLRNEGQVQLLEPATETGPRNPHLIPSPGSRLGVCGGTHLGPRSLKVGSWPFSKPPPAPPNGTGTELNPTAVWSFKGTLKGSPRTHILPSPCTHSAPLDCTSPLHRVTHAAKSTCTRAHVHTHIPMGPSTHPPRRSLPHTHSPPPPTKGTHSPSP